MLELVHIIHCRPKFLLQKVRNTKVSQNYTPTFSKKNYLRYTYKYNNYDNKKAL